MRRKNWEVGNVVEIELSDGSFCYGVIVPPRLIAFSSSNFSTKQEAGLELFTEVAFVISVMKYAIGKKHWPVVGHIEVNDALRKDQVFYVFDTIGKKYELCDSSFWTIKEVSADQCIGLECAAVWDPEHVESRLVDYKNGVPNIWAESLKAEKHFEK